MLPRIIPVVIVNRAKAIWTQQFKYISYLGDPLNICRLYSEMNVSEIFLLDRTSSGADSSLNNGILRSICREISVPLSYGGGLQSEAEIDVAFEAGVDKIVLKDSSVGLQRLSVHTARNFGRQALTICANYAEQKGWNLSFTRSREGSIQKRIEDLAYSQAGEILVQCVTRAGSRQGLDTDRLAGSLDGLSMPTVISGGAAGLEDIGKALAAGFSGVAVSTLFSVANKTNAPLVSYLEEQEKEILFARRLGGSSQPPH